MSFGKILGIFMYIFLFVLLTFLGMINIINISDDTGYLGILIYVGVIVIIIALPEEVK